jgi:2-dehydro-3-deoxyphosphogluconate aldolase/(4S)-4-hydroxy-2-oxoglutarate aldolase
MSQNNIRGLLANHKVIPVINFKTLNEVEQTIAKLIKRDIHCIEITLRNELAYDCIRAAKHLNIEGFYIGIGTVVTKEQIAKACDLEVDFMVSPGINSQLAPHFEQSQIPFIPGVATPSEIILGKQFGWDTFKFFPANVFGGVSTLKTYGQVFPDIKFCPTGGITEEDHQEYLDLPNVISVGGSWVI